MVFLQGVAAKVIQWLLAKGATALYWLGKFKWASWKKKKETAKDIENLEKASTPDEIKKSTDDLASHF